MPSTTNATLIETVRETAHRLTGATGEYDPLMDLIGDARFVLLGEATHGTSEFYTWRDRLSRRLIAERGFSFIAVEADWPDAYRVNRYVRGASDDVYGIEALADFRRFPAWMWRNTDVVEFVEWLRVRNDSLPVGALATGFYGLISTASTSRWRPWSDFSRRSTPRPRSRPARATPASTTSAGTLRSMGS